MIPDDTKKEKVARFLADPMMSDSVREVIRETYLKPRPITDVQVLAASRIALDLLAEAWRELERYKAASETEKRSNQNIGL